ncbi:RNA-directed DNA polymerase, eukaryota, reverse transcriptase zinc-binding domain protein [Tanacetum coccineum]
MLLMKIQMIGTDIELDEHDVYIDRNGTAKFMTANEVSVLETHMKNDRIDKVCMNIFGSWSRQNNVKLSRKGCRIAVRWDCNSVNCSLITATEQSMLYHVEVLSSQKTFYCTFIYSANKGRDRKELWKELNMNKRVIGNSAWVIIGDVNVSLKQEDHSKGISNFTQDMIEFHNCVNEVEIEDINCTVVHFTWTKSLLNPNSTILKKIDRVMSNCEFITQFNNANVVFLLYGISDHSPAILKIPQVMVKKNKSFRLANYITEDEEKLLMQKAKVNWLKEGDKNTAYFHKVLKGRLNRNRIMSICDEDGTRFKNCEVANQFVKYFEGFLGISPIVSSLTNDDNGLFEGQILMEEANLMTSDVTDEEIKKDLFDIDDNKAPEADGFTSKFFKKSWDIIKRDFCATIKEFFNSGNLLGEVNATLIFLVPKMLTPQKVSDFRPITCCNVIYICISKILTNRIKSALNQIIDDNQSSFVPRRAITDNILLTQELLKGSVSGLYPNLGKCTMFCGSLDDDTKEEISSIFPFKEGKLLVRKESLWVKWINVVKLKQRSVWDVDIDSKDSWGWKCLLNLRSWVGNHMRYKIGDDKSINVWYDKWNSDISLSSLISKKKVFYVGFKDQDKIHDVMDDNGWKWPQNWLDKYPWIASIRTPSLVNQPDQAIWVDNNGNERRFLTNTIWKDVRGNYRKVNWYNLVWHSNCIPKHTFLLWIAARKKLCTQDRMGKWYPNKVFACSLCNKVPNSHEHLFFKCVYTQKVWKMICNIAKLDLKEDKWDNILDEMSKGKDNGSIWGVIRMLCLAANVYFIWQERNKILFNSCKRD